MRTNIRPLFPSVEVPTSPRREVEMKVRLDPMESWAVRKEANERRTSQAQVLRELIPALIVKHRNKRSVA